MARRIIAIEGYEAAVAALGQSAAAKRSLAAALLRLEPDPGRWPEIPGTSARVIRTHKHPELLSLCLYYRVEGEVVYLYDVRLAGGS